MKYFLILALVMFFIACNENNVSNDFGVIKGKVYDSETNELLNLVELSTSPATSNHVTTTNGTFRFENILNGDYKIIAKKEGYKTKEVSLKVLGGKETSADIYMVKGSGTITDTTDNNPIDTTSVVPKEHLVAYFKFDGNANDNSTNLMHGQAYSVTYGPDRNGNGGKAIEFQGSHNSYVDVPFTGLLNLTSFTYSFWINPSENYGTPDNQGYIDIISRWGNWGYNQQSYAFSIKKSGALGLILYNLTGSSSGSSDNYTYLTSNQIIQPNKWTHVAIVHDADVKRTKIYVNGALDIDNISVTPQASHVYGLRFGKRIDVTTTLYQGKLDELKIFKIACNQSQVQNLFKE